jgi:hypothetical protein
MPIITSGRQLPRRLALLLWLYSPIATHAADSPPRAPALTIGAGEIKVGGIVQAVDVASRTLALNVDTFTLATGRTSRLAVAKPKTIRISPDTLLWQMKPAVVRGLSDLEPGTPISAIGRDLGSGHDLSARVILIGDDADPAARLRRPIDRAQAATEAAYIRGSAGFMQGTAEDMRGMAAVLRTAVTAARAGDMRELERQRAAARRYSAHERGLLAAQARSPAPAALHHLRDLLQQYLSATNAWLGNYSRWLSDPLTTDLSQSRLLHARVHDLLLQIGAEINAWKDDHGIRTRTDADASE